MEFNICKTGSFFNIPNKFWEVQMAKFSDGEIFDFRISYTTNCDHAGFKFHFEVLGIFVTLQVYDCRHWDYDTNKYVG